MDGTAMGHGLRISVAVLAVALPALCHAADKWAKEEALTVVMVDNRFEPDHLEFHAGQPYELRLENHGKDMHEFTAPAFLKAAIVKDKTKLANGGTDIVVQAGTSVSISLIAPPKGHYDLTCADHDWDGMVGIITVD
jgi:plastocyanin